MSSERGMKKGHVDVCMTPPTASSLGVVGEICQESQGPHVSVGGKGMFLAWGGTGLPRPGPPAGVLVGRVRVDFYRSFGSFLLFVGFRGGISYSVTHITSNHLNYFAC